MSLKKEGPDPKDWSGYTVGLNFGMSAIVGMLFGLWADSAFGTKPWGVLIGLFMGMVAGFRVMWQATMSNTEELGEKNQTENEAKKTDKTDV